MPGIEDISKKQTHIGFPLRKILESEIWSHLAYLDRYPSSIPNPETGILGPNSRAWGHICNWLGNQDIFEAWRICIKPGFIYALVAAPLKSKEDKCLAGMQIRNLNNARGESVPAYWWIEILKHNETIEELERDHEQQQDHLKRMLEDFAVGPKKQQSLKTEIQKNQATYDEAIIAEHQQFLQLTRAKWPEPPEATIKLVEEAMDYLI